MSCDRGGDVLKVGQMLGDDRLGWSAVVANSLLRAMEAEERAKAEHATAEACERDLQCIGNEKSIEAAFACRPWVERMAKNDFQWTDHWYEGKFDRFRWHDKSHDVITYVGDKIKFQNGFGAWVRSKYECDYNFRKKSVADIRVEAGQLPP
jgi:hypothetical protein